MIIIEIIVRFKPVSASMLKYSCAKRPIQ
jgi:hypothetical protein